MRAFNPGGDVWWPRYVLNDSNSKGPKTVYQLHLKSADVDGAP